MKHQRIGSIQTNLHAMKRSEKRNGSTKTLRGRQRENNKSGQQLDGIQQIEATDFVDQGDCACLARTITFLVKRVAVIIFLADRLKNRPVGTDVYPGRSKGVLVKHGHTLMHTNKDCFLLGAPRSHHILRDECCTLVLPVMLDKNNLNLLDGIEHHSWYSQ